MSKFTTTVFTLALMLAACSANAQMADRLSEHPRTRKAQADEAVILTREMTNQLHLNEGQYLKLLALNRTKLAGLSSIENEYRNDADARAAKVAELEAQYEQACSRVLTSSQLSQLQQDNHPAGHGSNGNGLG